MEHSDFLFVCAEIGIAFAGFAGLVTVLASRLNRSASETSQIARLRIVLFSSLLLVLASLFPYVCDQIVRASSTDLSAWRLSALLLVAVMIYYQVFELMRPARVVRQTGTSFARGLYYTTTILVLASWTSLSTTAMFFPTHTSTAYVASTFVLVWVAASMLFRLFVVLVETNDA